MDLFLTNVLVAAGIAGLWYLKDYLHLGNEVIGGDTCQVSSDAYTLASNLAPAIQHRLESIRRPVLLNQKAEGKELDIADIVLNKIREQQGLLKEPEIFMQEKRKEVGVGFGILFSNTITARYYENGFPLETTVQALYEAADAIPYFETAIWAYDADLHIIKSFDKNLYDVTRQGLMPKKKGYHNKLAFALSEAADRFDAGKKRVLYVVTTPIEYLVEMEHVDQVLDELRSSQVNVAMIYLSDEDIDDPIINRYCTISTDNLEELPVLIGRLNKKL